MLSLSLIAAAPLFAPTAALSAPAASTPAVDGHALALKARHVHVGDGSVLSDAYVVVEGATIKSVGKSAPKGVRVIEVDGHVAPGFIGMRERTGAAGETSESARKSTPTADLAYAFDPEHPGWEALVANGVTTVVLTAGSDRIAGGMAAIVSPARGEVVKRGAAMTIGMSRRSISSSVEPTSYAGLHAHVKAAFEADAGGHFSRAKAGKLPVMIEAISRSEVARAAAFAKQHGLAGAIVGAPRADETLDAIKGAKLGVVFEPLSPGSDSHVVDSVIALDAAGVPFAFTSDGRPGNMRMTAAACTRAGLDPGAALRALTGGAAALAGVGATHGTIAAGMAADIVVWSGSPTDLTSRVHAVYAGGDLVHSHEGAHGQGAGH